MTQQQSQAHNHDLGAWGDIPLQRSGPEGKKCVVNLKDMFDLLRRGGTRRILRDRPEINRDAIALGRAFLIATCPHLYDQEIAPDQAGDISMLVDECISSRIIPTIRKHFGPATSVKFTGLEGCGNSGTGDSRVWEWSIANGIDAIITKDLAHRKPGMDLTRIAKDHALEILKQKAEDGHECDAIPELPVIIHVISDQTSYDHISDLFSRFRLEIADYVQTCIAPVIVLNESGVRLPTISIDDQKLPATYTNLWLQHLISLDKPPTREQSKVKQWFSIIKKEHPNMDRDRKSIVQQQLRDAAEVSHISNDHSPQASYVGILGVPRPGSYLP